MWVTEVAVSERAGSFRLLEGEDGLLVLMVRKGLLAATDVALLQALLEPLHGPTAGGMGVHDHRR